MTGGAQNISRVLVANRGEIAVRVVKACRAMGLETVVAVSRADKEGMAAGLADRMVCIGPPRPLDSYLFAAARTTVRWVENMLAGSMHHSAG